LGLNSSLFVNYGAFQTSLWDFYVYKEESEMQNNAQCRCDRLNPKVPTATVAHIEENRGRRAETNLVDDAVPAQTKESVFGVITDCLKLNVRKEPKVDADVLTVIPVLSKVQVDAEASADEFYKVCTETGIEGFCVKKYVALKR